MKDSKTKIGIFGGTFNPVHYGHLLIAENACFQYELDQVIFFPTGHTPHKQYMGQDMDAHRCRMLEAAIRSNPKFSISLREIERKEVNYTYQTLAAIHEEQPEAQLYFILGADSLFDFEDWRHPEQICAQAVILAAVRDSLNAGRVDRQIARLREKYGWEIHRLDTPNLSISSRDLRARAGSGQPIRYLVPPEVEAYIKEHRLYEEEK